MTDALLRRLTISLVLTSIMAIGPILLLDAPEGQVSPPQLNPMKLYMMEGMTLEPLKSVVVDEFQAVTIPDGFVRDGLRGFGIIPLGHTYWKPVGTWYSQPVRQKINLGGQLEVGIWCYRESNSVTSDFVFQLMRDDSVILQASVSGARINADQDTLVTARAAFPPGNDTTIDPGSVISLFIQARCNGGATLKYGSSSLDSGFSFSSNSLSIHDLRMTPHNVILEYKDAFMAPWTKLYIKMSVNKIDMLNEKLQSLSNAMNISREIYWERESRPGQEYEVFVTVGYSPELNISDMKVVKLVEKGETIDLRSVGRTVLRVAVIIAAIAFSLVLFSTLNRRRWKRRFERLPPDKRDGTIKERKTAWKEVRDQRKVRRKERTRDRVHREAPQEREGFGIFKRSRRDDRPAPGAQQAPPPQTSDELEL